MRIRSDDGPLEIMESVNTELAEIGFRFVNVSRSGECHVDYLLLRSEYNPIGDDAAIVKEKPVKDA